MSMAHGPGGSQCRQVEDSEESTEAYSSRSRPSSRAYAANRLLPSLEFVLLVSMMKFVLLESLTELVLLVSLVGPVLLVPLAELVLLMSLLFWTEL